MGLRPRVAIAKLRPDVVERLALPRLPRQLPEEQIGHCMVCGAGFIEHVACESGNCHFVRTIEDEPA